MFLILVYLLILLDYMTWKYKIHMSANQISLLDTKIILLVQSHFYQLIPPQSVLFYSVTLLVKCERGKINNLDSTQKAGNPP